jgi:hypothetical protein
VNHLDAAEHSARPHFYIDVREADRMIHDEGGLELENLEASEREAVHPATGINQDNLSKGITSEIEVQVKNHEGFLLLTVTVSATVRALA